MLGIVPAPATANTDEILTRPCLPLSMAMSTSALYNTTTNTAVARGAAGKYLIVTGAAGSPYMSAQLYDDALDTYTALTISGALGEAANQTDATMYLTYSDEQGKYYLKTSGAKKFYPLTLSGTTLTIGTAVDITAAFAGTTATIAMTGDRTDLWFLDTAGVLKKYDLSAVSMGSALAVPSLTGFDTTNTTYWKLHYANGYLWFFAAKTASASGIIGKIQKYNISGNSWSTITIPAALTSAYWGAASESYWSSIQLMIDPTVDTYFYIATLNNVWKFTVSDSSMEYIYSIGTASSITLINTYTQKSSASAASKYEAADFSRGFSFYPANTYTINPLRWLTTDSSLWVTITGAGYLEGIQSFVSSAAGYQDLQNNVLMLYQIDGGAIKKAYLWGKKWQSLNGKKIYFASSLKVIGFWCASLNSGQPNMSFTYHLN